MMKSYEDMPVYIIEFFEFFGQVLLNTLGLVGEQSPERSAGPLSRHQSAARAPPSLAFFRRNSTEKVSRPCYL